MTRKLLQNVQKHTIGWQSIAGSGILGGVWLFRGATGLAAAALLLAFVCFALMLTNRSLVRQTDEQRDFLQQTVQLNGVNETLVRLIARAAIDEKDQQLRDLLVSHGFRFQGDAPPAPANPAAPATPSPPEQKK
jgi:hypothetical protein